MGHDLHWGHGSQSRLGHGAHSIRGHWGHGARFIGGHWGHGSQSIEGHWGHGVQSIRGHWGVLAEDVLQAGQASHLVDGQGPHSGLGGQVVNVVASVSKN